MLRNPVNPRHSSQLLDAKRIWSLVESRIKALLDSIHILNKTAARFDQLSWLGEARESLEALQCRVQEEFVTRTQDLTNLVGDQGSNE